MLKIENLTKIFNPATSNEKIALDDISIEINDGDFVTVIGDRKSTRLNSSHL